ncbi:hypothetical protein PR202_ga00183 [Eleusine coracana subsp. coracana]|uniref:Uncharacterized protein n=1 Tax=Eleusine coracana subsp. coracana TaxID=191504 RepID=A0AAV5BEH2_ELECO|nr:hypothetical protein PR202_ga00183 [Eleusine coracana subsp. coracana]
MDSRLGGQYPKKGAHAIAGIALQCIRNEAKMRPQMSEVLVKLEELQDPKYSITTLQVDTRRTASSSSSVSRSPMRTQPSPQRSLGSASPLPAAASPLATCRTAELWEEEDSRHGTLLLSTCPGIVITGDQEAADAENGNRRHMLPKALLTRS